MTHTVQTSLFTSGRLYSKHQYPGNLYQFIVNTEEGESYENEI